ncbi:MAG: type II toxin-antitoxin system RelE family toxin [Nitriliruptorales bacterium]
MARVVLARSARLTLEGLDFPRAQAVLEALAGLERDPYAGHRLRGRLSGLWSYRVGVYRIIYEIKDETTVRVAAIRHRGQAYPTDPR